MATLSSVDVDTPTGRRLRAGKEIDSSSPESPSSSSARKPSGSATKSKGGGTKRPRSVSSGVDEAEQDSKRAKTDLEKTPLKQQATAYRIHAKLPLRFWYWAVKQAAYIYRLKTAVGIKLPADAPQDHPNCEEAGFTH